MNADGSGKRNLFLADELQRIAWSPDGRSIALAARLPGENYDVWVVDVETGATTLVATGPDDQTTPTWSPDGTHIAYEHRFVDEGAYGAWIMVYSIASGESTAITPDNRYLSGPHAAQPAWSPDGSRIAYAQFSVFEHGLTFGRSNIATIGADGTDGLVLTHNVRRDCQNPKWGSVNNRILFDRGLEPSYPDPPVAEAILSMKADGTDRIVLSRTGEELIGWSPDGRWVLAIRKGYNGELTVKAPGIYVIRANGKAMQRVVPGRLFAGVDWQAR